MCHVMAQYIMVGFLCLNNIDIEPPISNPFKNRLQYEFHHMVLANKGTHLFTWFVVKSIVIQINGQGYGSIN